MIHNLKDTLRVTHPPKLLLLELDFDPDDELELDFEPEDDPSPLDVPPMPPALEEVPRLVMEPVDEVDVLGLTTEPATVLF